MIPLHGPQLAVAKGLVQFNEAMKPCKATQDRRVSVESSDKTWSTGEGNGSPLQYSCLDNPWTVWKGKKIWFWKMSPQVGSVQRATGQEQRALPTALRRTKGRGCSGYTEGGAAHYCTVGGTNRCKGQTWEGAWELPKEKETREGNVVVWGLQISEKWKAREKGTDSPTWMQSPREEQGEIRKPFKQTVQRDRRKQQNGKD